MAKEEPGRLLSKVAKFVRNPLRDWADLEAPDAEAVGAEAGYSREALKEMIERRQRNDFVRRREFDMLRKLRQREAAGAPDASATPSSFNVSSSHGKTEGRALTLKKIDEIEEQMSQQWWKGRPSHADGTPAAPASSAELAQQHARAYADTAPGLPEGDAPRYADTAPPSTIGGLHPSRFITDGAVEEAGIRFAQGDDAGAEAILLQAVAPDGANAGHDETWLALLDLYRATGDSEKFAAASLRYAQRLKRQGPAWLSLRALARDRQAAIAQRGAATANASSADWFSGAELSRDALGALTRALVSVGGPVWTLDWRALKGISPDAAAPFKALLAHWAQSPVQLRFIGGARLAAVLEAYTPSNERGVDPQWWELRMEALRVMHAADDFELAALNYCITYEVSPPAWTEPAGSYTAADAAPASGAPAEPDAGTLSLAGMADAPNAPAAAPDLPELVGELAGQEPVAWHRLDAELADAADPALSCAALVRVDFAAAGALLDWVIRRDELGMRVRLVDTHRLLVAFFRVVGISDHAAVTSLAR